MLKYLRWLLLPLSWLYGAVIIVRNWCYDAGVFQSTSFDMPVISVGNLDVGGAGKTPMAEYLVRLFKGQYKLATLSRGYGRKTSGFLVADETTTFAGIGDEPAQFAQKFPNVTVAVCEKRVDGINHLKANHGLIILDDAYQHRAVKPGLSILLFDYHRVFEPRFMLPAGNLREPFSGRKRADVVVVTKCPAALNKARQQRIISRLNLYPHQKIFFAGLSYGALTGGDGREADAAIDKQTTVFLLTGIANAEPLVKYMEGKAQQVVHHNYPDHHSFTLKNMVKLAAGFKCCMAAKKLVITTEKDIQRLRGPELLPLINELHLLVIPIQMQFLNGGQTGFNQLITNYVKQHTTNRGLH